MDIVSGAALVRTPRWRHRGAAGTARARPGIHGRVSGGHSRCHETATCARDPAHCELPDGRRHSRSEPGYGPNSGAVHGTPAGRTTVSKKNFCCVTTHRRNIHVIRYLGCGLGAFAARPFRLCVLSLGRSLLSPPGLTPCRLPATNLALAFRILAVTLVPTPRLVLASTPLAQASPFSRRAGPPPTGRRATVCLIVAAAHGSPFLPRDSPGRTCYRSLRAIVFTRNQTDRFRKPPMYHERMNKTEKETALERHSRRRRRRTRPPRRPAGWRSSNAQNWLCFNARSQLGNDRRTPDSESQATS